MDFSAKIFGAPSPTLKIPPTAKVVFVSDMFVSDYQGGAELTTEALIKASPLEVYKLHSKHVTLELLEQGHDKFWIFGNWSNLNQELIPTIVANMAYSVIEYDYKYCRYRSPEKHMSAEQSPCDCHNEMHGKIVSAFMYGARSLWWMSEKQQQRYHQFFPFLAEKPNCVLSSMFDDESFAAIKQLRGAAATQERKGWIVLGSPSWIKGADAAKAWCEREGHEYEMVWGLPHHKLLEKLSLAEGHVYLPEGGDTCPRMVIEAKLLGCKLHLNDHVQHRYEEWFDTDDTELTESYLYAGRQRFWDGIKHDMEYKPSLSGYTTTRNCIDQKYPWRATITSLLGFCDEVVVMDGGSTDGTWEALQQWSSDEERLKVYQADLDYNHPRFAVWDGKLKAMAREKCTGEFCWQMDSDEIVHERDWSKIRDLLTQWQPGIEMIALPLVEYWGSQEKVRLDVQPWKWRISRNDDQITHGIPAGHRRYDEEGNVYSAGSDGCDMIHALTGDPIPFATFYTADVEACRREAVHSETHAEQYCKWYQNVVDNLPTVHHFSWWNIERKMHTYKNYWQKHWNSLFNKVVDDTPENNMFFDKAWADVTDEEIAGMAKKLGEEMGGWIFHRRVDFNQPTQHVQLKLDLPESVREWAEENKHD